MSWERFILVESKAPHLIRLSITFLFTFLKSTFLQKSNIKANLPEDSLAEIIASIAASPTFFIAARPNLIPSSTMVNCLLLSFTSGGSILMPIDLHSLIYLTILSVLPISLVSKEAINSTG